MTSRKRERIVWISIVSAMLITLAVVFLSPIASAQTFKNENIKQHIRDLEATLHILQTNYVDEVEIQELFKGAMNGMLATLDDPYSVYLDNEFLEQMTDTTQGKYGGVGLYISRDRFNSDTLYGKMPYVKVVAPMENTPSWRAGINAGDYIYAIEGDSAENFSTQDVSNRLRGFPGSDVNVTILRDENITFDVVLKRAEIEIPTVKTTVINDKTAYLRIIQFTPFTESRIKDAITEFLALGLDELIIDVRSNPGGLLDSVIEVADFFFSNGVVVSTQYRQKGQNKVHRASRGKLVPSDMKIVVLIDQGSASASEILTGALKDRNRATIIGRTSYGKGSIQHVIPLEDKNSAIKLTTGRYYTPKGHNIDKTGIEPDITIEEPELTESQAEAYATILQENRIGIFIDENSQPDSAQVTRFVQDLQAENLDPGERIIRLMVKRESERRLNTPPVVDLEYDSTLIRALDFLETGQ